MSSDPDDACGAVEGASVFQAYHDPDGPADLSTTVVETVASVAGVDPRRTEVPIDHSVDPEALDGLFEPTVEERRRPTAHLTFAVWDLTVVVHGDGRIFVHE